jgi:phosphatidylserine/phosphatidylglycerophosphate/cardiolipin synthase-like enzyme
MRNAVAFSNNDVVTIAWSYGKRPDGCMGFALYRIDSKGTETVLPSHAVFKGETIKPGQTTAEFPIQKFYWKDPYARLAGEKTGSMTFRYKIVPLEGDPKKLTPMKSLPILTTNEVEVTPVCSPSLSAVFNRGIISTQHVTNALNGQLDSNSFKNTISKPGNQLRLDLAGEIIGALTGFLGRAKKSGTIYAALYELTDLELIQGLVSVGSKLHIVMADIVAAEPKKGNKTSPSENEGAWNQISNTAKESFYRQPPSGHIVHNKFLIYADASGVAQAVLAGSTNWTDTGLCAQTNNAIIIDDKNVAARYMAYWQKLKADQVTHAADSKAFQAAALRSFNATGKQLILVDKASADDAQSTLMSYFSPNTPKARSKQKGKGEVMPVDMTDLSKRVNAAKHAVLFLAFIPGTPSITEFAAAAQKANKDLFVRGCVTSPDAAGNFYYDLKGTSPPKKQPVPKGQAKPKNAPAPEDPRVLAATALDKNSIPPGWKPELLKAGFAIIHDKIVVIDPFDEENCTVVTGSHNLGYQASYNNDENLLLIQGNKKLAMAYATHVLDVYDHFAWRWSVRQGEKGYDATLKATPDEWLGWYFDANGEIKTAQLKFWMQATV